MKEPTPYLSVIIPAYREEKSISRTIREIDSYLSKQSYTYEIVVVNDGSPDNTAAEVSSITDIRCLRFIDNKINRGKGAVVRQGMLDARGLIRLFTDADNATSIDHFEKMRPLFDEGYDVVIGSRDSKDAEGARQIIPQPVWKRLLGNMGNLYIQIMAVPGIWDTQCGFKALTSAAAEKIFRVAIIDRWGFDIEFLALARRYKLKIGIIPVLWKNSAVSRVKISGYFQVIEETTLVRWRLLTGYYSRREHTSSL